MEIELVKFSKTSTNGINKIGKLGLVLTIKNINDFKRIAKFVKRNFYSTVENIFTPSKNITYYFYHIIENLKKILIPRFLLDELVAFLTSVSITNVVYKHNIPDFIYPIPESIIPTLLDDDNYPITDTFNKPWENKLSIIEYILNRYKDPFQSGLILDLPTGAGKTVMISYLSSYYANQGYKVHIIVTNKGLIKQTLDEFTNKTYIRQLGGDKTKGVKKFDPNEDKQNCRILISTIHSLANYIKNNINIYDYFDDFYLTCIDEPQLITTVNRFKALKMVQTKLMLGLSASAEKSIFIKEYIGPLYKPAGFTSIKFDIKVIKLCYSGSEEFCQNKKRWFAELGEEKNCAMKTNLLIETDPYRNMMIYNLINELIHEREHPCVLILTKNLEHIDLLHDMISNIRNDTGNENDTVNEKELKPAKWTGSRTEKEVAYATDEANVILATFDSFGVGTNIPKITAMIYATSYRDEEKQIQFFGRALRPDSRYNHITREIYDIVDTNVFLSNHFGTRKKVYKAKKVPIFERFIDYSEIKLPNKGLSRT